MSHYEIVRTDAEQPWHTRLVGRNGEIVQSGENLAERDDAANVVAIAAEAFGIQMSRPPEQADPETQGAGFLGEMPSGHVHVFEVREVDERQPEDPDADEEQPA